MRAVITGLMIALLVSGAAHSQDDADDEPVFRIELTFASEGVTVGAVDRITAPGPSYYGFAQGEPLFFEILGEKGEVLYAEPLKEPRLALVKLTEEERARADAPHVRSRDGAGRAAALHASCAERTRGA